MSLTPEAPLQFDCPACGAVLTVPASIAGMQGPCPKCWQEIISPDPAIGMPARLPAPPKADAPFSPPAPEPVLPPVPAPTSPPDPESALPPIAKPEQTLSIDLPLEPEPAVELVVPPEPAPIFPSRLEPAPPPISASEASPDLPPELDPIPSPVLPPEPAPIFPPRLDPVPTAGSIPTPPTPPVPTPANTGEIPTAKKRKKHKSRTRSARRSKLLLALGIVMPIIALAALGYHFGKDFRPNIVSPTASNPPAQPPSPAKPAPESSPAPAPTPDETGQGLQAPPAPPSSGAADAQAALLAFLGAPDWEARSAFVFSPDEMRPEMEKHAKDYSDGPIPASAIQLNQADSTAEVFVFKVCTKAMPDGFPVPVILTDDGPKVDWEAFIAFNDDHFKKLLTGPTGQSAILNILVKPTTDKEPSPHWVRYRLTVPMPGREAVAWVRKDSVAMARLKSVFDGENGVTKETVDQLVSGDGMPLRLALAKRKTNDGREFIEVVDMVAVWWAPAKRD